ncbi:MAG: hypothetical protein RQ735_11355 [Flavobacteriaceae bacterium]|nr:hypothetical protein [Flavobacteriaceae bacterium]
MYRLFSQIRLFSLVLMTIFVSSCGSGDDGITTTPVPPVDLGEQALIDDAAILEFLNTHFYNQEDFVNPPPGFNFDIEFDTIAGENTNKTPLIDLVEKKTFAIDSVTLNYYVLKAREGVNKRPNFVDSTLVNFRGTLLNSNLFDSNANPIWFDLTQVVVGFRLILTELKSADGFDLNPDGTSTFFNFGVGAVFFPSALGFQNITQPGIPANSPLIFRVKLFAAIEADHDLDGIPSFIEDLNGNENIGDDDTDGDGFPNFIDTDDDGDFILTRNEITINADGTITFTDCDGDGIPDYLDKDICPN